MSVFAARNPFLRPGEDAVTPGAQITASAEAEWPLDFRTVIETEGTLGYRQYGRSYGQFLTGGAELALVHRRNEYLTLRTQASFDRSLPIESLGSSLDGAIDPVSLQDRYEASQSLTFRSDSYTTFTGRLGWSRIDPRGSALLGRTTAISFDAGAEKRLDPATTLGLTGQATTGRSTEGGDPRSWTVRGIATRRFPKAWDALIEFGVTQISRLGLVGGRETGPVQFAGYGSLCHAPARVRFCASAAIGSVVSSFGGIQREVSFATDLDWRTGERGTLVARGEYRRSPQGSVLPDLEVLSMVSRYEHQLDGRFAVYGGAEYQQRKGLSEGRMDSLTLRAGLLYRNPRR